MNAVHKPHHAYPGRHITGQSFCWASFVSPTYLNWLQVAKANIEKVRVLKWHL